MMKTASTIFFFFLPAFFLCSSVRAQCPPTKQGYHRVQKGETLYRISKKYRISIDDLIRWNGISKNAILHVCQELAIKPSATTPATGPKNDYPKQQGGTHRIKPGETIAGIAELYGYTEQRFRQFNGLRPSEPAWPGLYLKTSDCRCARPDDTLPSTEPVYVDDTVPTATDGPAPAYPTWEEAIANEDGPTDSGIDAPFGEDPFLGSHPTVAGYEKPKARTTTPTFYNKEIEKITVPENQNQNNKADLKLNPRVRRPVKDKDAPKQTFLSPEEELLMHTKKQKPLPAPKKEKVIEMKNPAATYMRNEEIAMLNEINLLRGNPSAYVKYIEEYKRNKTGETARTCDELIRELKKTPPLTILQPAECLYRAAQKHGEDQRPTGSLDHVGTDGSYPWDRVRRECPNMKDGNENIVGGPADVRDAIILLLVDEGISNRGHRRTLLHPEWQYGTCYKTGQMGRMPNTWIQLFGK